MRREFGTGHFDRRGHHSTSRQPGALAPGRLRGLAQGLTRNDLRAVRRNRKRPLLRNDDPEGTIRRLLEERSPLYEEVRHLSVRTDELTLEETCFGVTESARMALRG